MEDRWPPGIQGKTARAPPAAGLAYRPLSSPAGGLSIVSVTGVGRNWSWDSAARRLKVVHNSRARRCAVRVSMRRGRRNSSMLVAVMSSGDGRVEMWGK